MKAYIFILLSASFFQRLDAQSISVTCGLAYHYDAAGNRIARAVIEDRFAGKLGAHQNETDSSSLISLNESIYPNPTSGGGIMTLTLFFSPK